MEESSKENPFRTRVSKQKITENLMFGLLRGITFFVLFCAAYLFWDIFSKGAGKVFEGDKLINWTFLTEDPQTLHVIDENGTELKLSSKEYYSLKDKKTLEQWSKFLKQPKFPLYLKDLNQSFNKVRVEWNSEQRQEIIKRFVEKEKAAASQKFSFWRELLVDPKATATDFEMEPEEVSAMVSNFLLVHLNRETSRLSLVQSGIITFRAKHYYKIENLDLSNLNSLHKLYLQFLDSIPKTFDSEFSIFGDSVNRAYTEFLSSKEPKKFGQFKESLDAYSTVRKTIVQKTASPDQWQTLQKSLNPFIQAISLSLPSKDYAYSGGGIFPAIVGTLLLVVGAMVIAIILGVFCAIFLAEYGKSGKFLSIIRLAILNLAGVPSIIFGLFGFGLFVIFLDWNVSLLAGWFTLAFMVLPVVITASEEALRSIPQGFRESSLALGATKWTMIKTSVLPYAMPGILTSSILGVARAAGETAPIMFTAAYAKRSELPWQGLEHWTDFFFQGVMALPYHIYVVSAKIPQNEYTADMQYGTAFVFLLLVLSIASLSILLRNRLRKKYRW